jgi:hypothetical protein
MRIKSLLLHVGLIAAVADLYREWIDTNKNPSRERWITSRKAAAAYAAAAAAYAAAAAAYAAAAARSEAYKRQADKLIELLRAA